MISRYKPFWRLLAANHTHSWWYNMSPLIGGLLCVCICKTQITDLLESTHNGLLHFQLNLSMMTFNTIPSPACKLTCPTGDASVFLGSLRPLQALMTVLWRCRWISASSWFHSLSWAGPFMSLPRSWICCTLMDQITHQKCKFTAQNMPVNIHANK